MNQRTWKEAGINKRVPSHTHMCVIVLTGATLPNSNHMTSPRASSPLRQGIFLRLQSQHSKSGLPMLTKTGAGKWSMAEGGLRMVSSPTALLNEV